MRRTLDVCFLVLVAVVFGLPAAAQPITLASSDPDHLVADGSGAAQKVNVFGKNFESEGHPDRDQYMHWQIRRDDGGWQRCGRTAPTCRNTGFTGGTKEVFEISGPYVARPGFVELRVFRGLGESDITDPSQAANLMSGGWSNTLRIPVRARPPAAAPPAPTRTPTPKPKLGTCLPGFVWREAIPADHVCVPPAHRTLAAKQNAEAAKHRMPNGGPSGPDACLPGFVWRDAFANDHVCVTPAERAQAADDNRLGPSRTVK